MVGAPCPFFLIFVYSFPSAFAGVAGSGGVVESSPVPPAFVL